VIVPDSIARRSVFVDASAFIALVHRSDRRHGAARSVLEQLEGERRPLWTSNLVIAETHAPLQRALGHGPASSWLQTVRDINVVFEEPSDHDLVVGLLGRYSDKEFSCADAFSFLLMERLGIPVAFSFDRDFQQYGVATLP